MSVAYAEMLVAKNIHRTDSAAAARAADSIVKHFGYSNEGDLLKEMEELSSDPESLRTMLDSAQHRLEKIQQGIDPDTPPQAAKSPGSAQQQGR